MRARVLLTLAAMTGAMLLASSPAGAQDYPPVGPTLSVSPTTVVAGDTVEVSGSGFAPGETVLITVTTAPFAAPQIGVDDLTGDEVAMVPMAQSLEDAAAPEFVLAAQTEQTVDADADGSFTVFVTLYEVGTATITATGMDSGLSASATVTVLADGTALPETGSDVLRLIRIGGVGIVLGGMLLAGALVWRARAARTSATQR